MASYSVETLLLKRRSIIVSYFVETLPRVTLILILFFLKTNLNMSSFQLP